jgi:hypothetical protein
MATKKQVVSLAEKQGAEVTIDVVDGVLDVYVGLPNGFIWDNGYGSGSVSQEKYEGETMAEFWQQILDYIDYPVIRAE